MRIMGSKWAEIIDATQGELIDTGYLKRTGAAHREHFDGMGDNEITAIPSEFIMGDLAQRIATSRSGYDMPVLFEPDGGCCKYVAFCFQDPKRSPKDPETLSFTTPFGITIARMRRYKKYRFLWDIVKGVVAGGKGVWITDAVKLWAEAGLSASNDDLSLMHRVLRGELAMLGQPEVYAFGNHAFAALGDAGVHGMVKHTHPAARAAHLEKRYGEGVTTRTQAAKAILAELG